MTGINHHKLLLCLATLFQYATKVSSFQLSPSRYNFFPSHCTIRSKAASPWKKSNQVCVGSTKYDDDYVDQGSSFVSSDWTSSIYPEYGNATDSIIHYKETNDATTPKEKISMSEEDMWIEDAIDEIHNAFSTLGDQPLYDTSFDEPSVDRSIEDSIDSDMDEEIAMLVRCNESPDYLLIEEGRALPPLNKEERNDVSQLVVWSEDKFEATEFLERAVSMMFREHATPSIQDGFLSMDRAAIASWMTKSLHEEEEGKVSQHDSRVLKTMTEFSTYGSGRIVEEDFQTLYFRCIVGAAKDLSSVSVKRHLKLRTTFRDAVWRDIRAHGILSPIEEERLVLKEKLNIRDSELTVHSQSSGDMFVDECEILDWDHRAPEPKKSRKRRQNARSMSSHKHVEMANDKKTPLRIQDGEFVFIDEESCIGCMQCVNIAPSSFTMVESGRARTFSQRVGEDVEQAVDACPVSCMHRVGFQELSTFETARDGGETQDGKQFAPKSVHIPLHVAGMDSDRNRRSSWYHSLKAKCVTSSDCPQKGCYDCPCYRNPGENPFFIAKQKKAEHVRAQHFIESGEANSFRKAVDL
eukprot:CAMPEP_0201136556 /NCGR_PEP_ID=MMETSP0850-20130426/54946_1 /ASSEMBLY_ACC=CAM_ASM_000622 /TAXON_ID=183588 /ORGANISM="Pseudo-nitzschia fraudulenta, Strain WWA7" /LENGTH=579 /DNA_ID=CAMNT_0047407865 /DNA_START=148 /DNA_END=1887 /DNA_ORIENTATION=+